MNQITLEERLAALYPEGAPSGMIEFLKGEPTANAKQLYELMAASTQQSTTKYSEVSTRLRSLQTALEQRTHERQLAEDALTGDGAFTLPLDRLVARHNERAALDDVIQRISREIEHLATRQNALLTERENWSALEQLARVQLAGEIPSFAVAAMFGAQPQDLVPPARLARLQARAEQDRREEEERKAKQQAEAAMRIEESKRAEEEHKERLDRQLAGVEAMDVRGLIRLCFGDNPYSYLLAFLITGDKNSRQQTEDELTKRMCYSGAGPVQMRAYERLWEQYEQIANGEVMKRYPNKMRREAVERQKAYEESLINRKPEELDPERAAQIDAMTKEQLLEVLFTPQWRQFHFLPNFFITGQLAAAGQVQDLLNKKMIGANLSQKRMIERLLAIYHEINTARQRASV